MSILTHWQMIKVILHHPFLSSQPYVQCCKSLVWTPINMFKPIKESRQEAVLITVIHQECIREGGRGAGLCIFGFAFVTSEISVNYNLVCVAELTVFFLEQLWSICTELSYWPTEFATNFKAHYSAQKATIHQLITTQAISKNVLFPGHNHLLTTSTVDPSLAGAQVIDNQSVGSSVPVVSRWLWPGNMDIFRSG